MDKAKDRGYQLVYALRNLPETHDWNFNFIGSGNTCGSYGCAIGLARILWPDWRSYPLWDLIGHKNYDNIFYSNKIYGVPWDDVTPEMVADKLEEALNNAV